MTFRNLDDLFKPVQTSAVPTSAAPKKVLTMPSLVQPNGVPEKVAGLVKKLRQTPYFKTNLRYNPFTVESIEELYPIGSSFGATLRVYVDGSLRHLSSNLRARHIPMNNQPYIDGQGVHCVESGSIHLEFYQSD